jgi:hypothetical protein
VVVVGLLLWKFSLLTVPPIAKPSGQFKHLREPIALPIAPESMVTGLMNEPGDAGDLYWKAIDVYTESRETYDKAEPKYTSRLNELPAIDLLIEAAAAKDATIFLRKPTTVINYRYPWPEMDALMKLGIVANSIAFSFQAKQDEAQTKKYAHACFVLGARLYNERLVHGELDTGLKLMQTSGDTLRTLAKKQGDKEEEARWKEFGEKTSGYYTSRVQKLYQVVISAGAQHIDQNAGDVFDLAQHNEDRMWQVEALLKIGRFKFNAARQGDQIGAQRLLSDDPAKYGFRDWTQSKDAAVRAAGEAARKLTVEEYRTAQ